jgi:hypothetical protein
LRRSSRGSSRKRVKPGGEDSMIILQFNRIFRSGELGPDRF